jgi:hypothetical protein
VWTVLAGTAPFAGLGDLEPLERWLAGLGLLVAGAGATLGIYAASRVLEPEDASLGELKLRQPETRPSNWLKIAYWWLVRGGEHRTNADMWDLFKAESDAYFGSAKQGPEAVGDFIKQLQSEADTLQSKRVEAAKAEGDAKKAADREVEAARIAYDASLARRERTLAVAVTYQVRGKYVASRRMLVLAGLLVLLGTLLYLFQVAAKDDEEEPAAAAAKPASFTSVRVRLQPDTWTGLEVTAGGEGCVGDSTSRDEKLELAGYVRGDAQKTGPWQVLLPAGSGTTCRPVEFSLKQPDGRVIPSR